MIDRYHDALRLLKEIGAADIPHSGRSLLDHLLGTHALLAYWGADEDVCLAGLLHSVYGTRAGTALLANPPPRRQVVNTAGEYVADLIEMYSLSSLARQPRSVERQEKPNSAALPLIILANLVEQTIYLPHTCLDLVTTHASTYRDVLSQEVNDWIADFVLLVSKAIDRAAADVDGILPRPRVAAATRG